MDAPHILRARLHWVQTYERTGHAGLTCRRCGISRPTLRKWWRRYQADGVDGLRSRSRRPHTVAERKVTQEVEQEIMTLRRQRNLGPKRIQAQLLQDRRFRLSTATIWKVLRANEAPDLRKPRVPKPPKRYSRPVPGDRVQLDTMKVAPGLYQFTAIDDCTRIRVLGLYGRRTAANAVHFLEERMLEEFHFPIQRVQTDRGAEFFGQVFQEALHRNHIKFRPTPPRSPHLNGKVERSQLTDKQEFWALQDLSGKPAMRIEELEEELGCWQTFYNYVRPHGSLQGKTPRQRAGELSEQTPWSWEVWEAYEEEREFLLGGRDRNYAFDQQLQELKRSS